MGTAPESRNGRGAADRIDIGGIDLLGSLPRRIEVRGRGFYLVGTDGNHHLVSRVCPHKGGTVQDVGGEFVCPKHGWRFSHTDGHCLSSPSERLASYPVYVEGGRLVAELGGLLTARRERTNGALPTALSLAFHAHACIEMRYRGFSLLTDPWLDGPAFYGAWLQYPPPRVSAADLSPDVIWISHEHTDHFHERSLQAFSRDIPVYVPDFPNRRMPERLKRIGFTDIRALPFGERVEVGPDVHLTVFEPVSLWNDSIALLEAGGFSYLNLNDAGVNQRIADLISPVDLITSSFSPGASGYPLTWQHLDDSDKADIIERNRNGLLEMVRSACEVYGARYLLPFASYFTLWHPEHRGYLAAIRRNVASDLERALEGTGAALVDLLPGETWHPASGKSQRVVEREGLFDRERVLRHVEKAWDWDAFASFHPVPSGTLKTDEVEEYLLGLNDVPDIVFCENLTGVVHDLDSSGASVAFEVADGTLLILPDAPPEPNVTIGLPWGILEHIVRENESWDEMLIGYWGKLNRRPDVYHAGFWRLLQTPYYRKTPALPQGAGLGSKVIAEVLERYGDQADRILRRNGLYCFGCEHGAFETIEHGAWKHGLSDYQVERLLRELGAVLSS